MTIGKFPPVSQADQDGLLALGGDLEVESLLLAYRSGIFPWPINELLLTWFAPPMRTVLFLDRVHVSKSLAKLRNTSKLQMRVNHDVEQIIRKCSEVVNRGEQEGTWITPAMVKAYINLHHAGYCHAIGCYDGKELVGGVYGVAIGRMFAGESMFYRQANASKLALCYLIDYLRERSVPWIDCQVMTPLLESFGAIDIPRAQFMEMLQGEISVDIKLF